MRLIFLDSHPWCRSRGCPLLSASAPPRTGRTLETKKMVQYISDKVDVRYSNLRPSLIVIGNKCLSDIPQIVVVVVLFQARRGTGTVWLWREIQTLLRMVKLLLLLLLGDLHSVAEVRRRARGGRRPG